MACGTVENTYRTLESMIFVLPSGATINTADADADTQLKAHEPELFEGLLRLQKRVRENPCLLYTSPSPRDRTRSRMPSSA